MRRVCNGTYDANYNYVSSSSDLGTIGWKDLGTTNPIYCLENTQTAAYNVHAYTTQALLKVRYAPKNLKVFGSSVPVALQDGEDWFIMNNGFYTNATILMYIEEELKNKYMHNDPAGYETPITDGYNDYIAKLGINKIDISQSVQMNQTDAEAKASTVAHEFELLADQISAASAGGKSLGEVSYYAEGICYYKIMVKHDNKDADDFMNELGEFGVVRNSVYDIHVSGINNPRLSVHTRPRPQCAG
ncbi:MAG: Mfa1 fimbrilin C-terminal domain-containing protein [Bacteroides sp.]|nr:Mfa1 fimbrilin C-terminal domain-containing protein [Bacteroides sp.]